MWEALAARGGQCAGGASEGHLNLGSFVKPILHAVPGGVAVEDDSGLLVFVNRAIEQISGCEPGKLIGRRWTALIPRDVHQAVGAWQSGMLDEGAGPYEIQVQRADGTSVPVQVSASPLADGGQPKAMVWLFTDLTERYRLEAQIRQSDKMAWLGQSTSTVAHELNNPLTIILLQIKLLRAIAPLLPRFQESLAVIQQQAQRMVHIIDNLLTFAHPASRQVEPTDVNASVQHTLDLQLYQLHGCGIEVCTDLAPDLPASRIDPHQLEQVFVNLINNAQQALLAGDQVGMLMIQTRRAPAQNGDPPRTHIRFIDNGPGIPPEVMARLFEPFFTTKRAGQGTGLGLAVCDRIVREYGGRIWAQNNPGGGATFTVELPAENGPAGK
jgi:PAS domain S-box-containing protein